MSSTVQLKFKILSERGRARHFRTAIHPQPAYPPYVTLILVTAALHLLERLVDQAFVVFF